MNKKILKLFSIWFLISIVFLPVVAETLPGSFGSGWSQWQDSCPSGKSCQTKTFYRYRNVASWSNSWSTSRPTFYTSKTQYRVNYSYENLQNETKEYQYHAWDVNGIVAHTADFGEPVIPVKYRGANWGHTGGSSGNIFGSNTTSVFNCGSWTCSGWNKIGAYNNPGHSGSFSATLNQDTRYRYFAIVMPGANSAWQTANGYFDVIRPRKVVSTTGWQDSTSVPQGSYEGIAESRTVYAGPASWGGWSSWQDSNPGQTSSRQVESKTFYSYPLTQTNTIDHWVYGFKNQEGHNGSKNAFYIGSANFTEIAGNSFVLDSSRKMNIPNGFQLRGSFGTSSISGSWNAYNMGTRVTQKTSGMKFEYYYDPINYSISYNLNGGTHSGNPTSYNVLYGVKFNNATKAGYTFNGWYNSSGQRVTGINEGKNATFSSPSDLYNQLSSRQTGNVSLTARYTPTNYSISYNLNGGSVSGNPTSYNIESNTITLKNPTRIGYTFTGWTGSNGSTPQTNVTIAKGSTGNKSYTANWKANNYTLTYHPNGGYVNPSSKTLTYGAQYGALPTPTRPGYTFNGWYTAASGGSQVSSNTSAASGGSQVSSNTVMGASHTTIYAHWTNNRYTYNIVYKSSSGISLGSTTRTENFGSTHTITAPAKTGYTTPASQTVTWDSTSSKTITFTYNLINYSISYNTNGGSVSGQKTSYNIETPTFTLPTPSRTGHTFTGWTGSNGSTAQTSVSIAKGTTGNKSYTANWRANGYTLTYNANGGSVSPTSKSLTYGSQYGTLPTPTRTGYTFNGWYTAASGGNKVSETTTMGAGNTTIYAHWRTNKLTVNYYPNGGTPTGTDFINNGQDKPMFVQTGTYGSKWNGDSGLHDPIESRIKRVGYSHGGYNTQPNGSGRVVDYTNLIYAQDIEPSLKDGDRTLNIYVQWKANTYTVAYNSNGGSGSMTTDSIVYGNNYTTKANGFTRPGYTFIGWNEKPDGTGTSWTSWIGKPWLWSYDRSITLYAQWRPNVLTIKYHLNGGIDVPTENTFNSEGTATSYKYDLYNGSLAEWGLADYSSDRVTPPTGYRTKNRWNTKADGSGVDFDESTVYKLEQLNSNILKGDATVDLYAQWIPNDYTYNVIYKSSTGKNLGSTTVKGTFGTSQTVTAPAKTGYTTPAAQTVKFDSINAKTITFTYPIINYTIGYTLNGGSVSGNPTSYNVESSTITLKNPTRIGYTFTGWTGSNGSSVQTSVTIPTGSTGNKTYTANWKIVTYSISYTMNGGSATNPSSYNVETPTFSLNAPTRIGYTFTGWTGSNGNTPQISVSINKGSTGNKSYAANFKANTNTKYVVRHYWQDVSGGTYTLHETENKTGTSDASLTLTNLKKTYTGFTYLNGKVNNSVQTSTTIAPDGTRIIDLYYNRNKYTFTLGSVTGISTTGSTPTGSYVYGATITVKATPQTGYEFGQWKSNNSSVPSSKNATYTFTMPASNLTMTPEAVTVKFYIQHHGNGGAGIMEKVEVDYNGQAKLEPNAFYNRGYEFIGWKKR